MIVAVIIKHVRGAAFVRKSRRDLKVFFIAVPVGPAGDRKPGRSKRQEDREPYY